MTLNLKALNDGRKLLRSFLKTPKNNTQKSAVSFENGFVITLPFQGTLQARTTMNEFNMALKNEFQKKSKCHMFI